MTIAINTGNVGGIDDYSSLVDAIRLWLDRGSDLDVQLPTFIGLIEPYLNRELRTPDMDAATVLMLNGTGFTLPTDCLQIRNVTYNGVTLDSYSPSQLTNAYATPDGIVTGCPHAFSITGRQVTIAPYPSVPGNITLSYWQRIPSLTLTAPTNWLLTAHPDVYLYGSLAQAEAYIENPERAAQWTALFDAAIQSVKDAASRAKYGGPIVARTTRQVYGVRA